MSNNVFVNFGGTSLVGSIAAFGGQSNPVCNYTSPLARKFIYKEQNAIFQPLRRHIFRMKVRTAAEIRLNEITKKFMLKKLKGEYGIPAVAMTNCHEFDHCSYIIPKDEYEVRKITSYMTSKKMSNDYKKHMQELWTRVLFTAESHNFAGAYENVAHQCSKPATDEEFMAWMWYMILGSTALAFVMTLIYWWLKYGQSPQYLEIK